MADIKRDMYGNEESQKLKQRPERSWNKDINPTSMRIKGYKTKQCADGISERVEEIKKEEQRLTMQRLKTAQPKPGMLSAGVNSVYEIQTMSASGLTDSTRPATTVAS